MPKSPIATHDTSIIKDVNDLIIDPNQLTCEMQSSQSLTLTTHESLSLALSLPYLLVRKTRGQESLVHYNYKHKHAKIGQKSILRMKKKKKNCQFWRLKHRTHSLKINI
jgi:hypothetical protein